MDSSSVLKFVIVGHVDHGKSTLIGRLLYDTQSLPADRIEEIKKASNELGRETEFAYLLDHLEEERQQAVTIDITQVFFRTKKRHYVIIDAPGHVEFVKNMVTGASQAEAAVLIIDIQEGIQEQTRRHAYILSLLGLSQVIVVLNKMDLANFEEKKFSAASIQAGEFLKTVNIHPAAYIPVCAAEGDNITEKSSKMSWYKGPAFLEILDSLKNRETLESKPLIFPVQDVYRINGRRIAVGRVEAGIIRGNDNIEILPNGSMVKVGSVEKYLEECVNFASAGQSIGITTKEAVFIERGNVICLPDKEPVLTDEFSASIFWMSKKELKPNERLIIRCATQETACRIAMIRKRIDSSTLELIQEDGSLLKNLEVAEVVIKAKIPLALMAFDDVQELGRFVLMQEGDICAGGIVTFLNNGEK